MNRPCIRVILAATASLLASPLLAADQSDRQTETAIPRNGNLYGLGVRCQPDAQAPVLRIGQPYAGA